MFTKVRALGIAGAIAATTVLTAGAAGATPTEETAADESSVEAAPEFAARVERACARVPNLTARTERVLERIGGDADTVGSLLWLDGRIAQAEARDRTELAAFLENRRAVREASVDVFELRLERLGELADRCAEAGVNH